MKPPLVVTTVGGREQAAGREQAFGGLSNQERQFANY
jgi:hypothetical protein